jgi:hypothetical protein
MRRARLILLTILSIAPRAIRAQWQLSGDLGAAVLTQGDVHGAGVMTAGVTLDVAGDHTLLRTSALGARAGNGQAFTSQWVAAGSAITPSWHSWSLVGTGGVGVFTQTSITAINSADLLVQLQAGTAVRGLALGGGWARTSHNDVAIPSQRGVADAWWSFRAERFSAAASVTRTRAVFGESSILVDISRTPANYQDLSAGWRHEGTGWSIGASAGMRGRNGTFSGADGWQSVSATLWAAPHVGVLLDAGRANADFVRGIPRSSYASVGLRIAMRPRVSLADRRATRPRVQVARVDERVRRIELVGLEARRVELIGDFTDWAPVTLERRDARWTLERPIPPGPHRIAIRIDGGEWVAPPSLPRVDDDLAGSVGLITIP